jgi:recombination endonuclease VII
MGKVTECSVPGCEAPVRSRELCSAHYTSKRRSGELEKIAGRHSLTNFNPQAMTADCAVCGTAVPVKRQKGPRGARCRKAYKATKGKSGGQTSPEARRAYRLRTKYGITHSDYMRIFNEQEGRCAVCEKVSEVVLHVDHDHQTGEVRGLLCRRCNLSLGYLRDSPYNAVGAARYLMRAIQQLDRR